jgi:valyl-tRNA synthetase
MHPMIPFATERLFWALNDVMPQRGIPGRFELPPAPRCIRAKWPQFDEKMDALTSQGAERVVERLQEIVQAIRTIRTENKVDPRKVIPVAIRHPAAVGHHLEANKSAIELWASCQITDMGQNIPEPANAARTAAAECEIFVMGVIDSAAEAGRLARERADLEKKVKTLRGRLENKGYTDKAPPHLVKQTRDELAQAEAELASLG